MSNLVKKRAKAFAQALLITAATITVAHGMEPEPTNIAKPQRVTKQEKERQQKQQLFDKQIECCLDTFSKAARDCLANRENLQKHFDPTLRDNLCQRNALYIALIAQETELSAEKAKTLTLFYYLATLTKWETGSMGLSSQPYLDLNINDKVLLPFNSKTKKDNFINYLTEKISCGIHDYLEEKGFKIDPAINDLKASNLPSTIQTIHWIEEAITGNERLKIKEPLKIIAIHSVCEQSVGLIKAIKFYPFGEPKANEICVVVHTYEVCEETNPPTPQLGESFYDGAHYLNVLKAIFYKQPSYPKNANEEFFKEVREVFAKTIGPQSYNTIGNAQDEETRLCYPSPLEGNHVFAGCERTVDDYIKSFEKEYNPYDKLHWNGEVSTIPFSKDFEPKIEKK